MSDYAAFLESKAKAHVADGITVDTSAMSDGLFQFSKDVAAWSLKKGRSCVFAGTGLTKTAIQCEYAKHIPGVRLIVAPLGVTEQTINEAVLRNGLEIRRANHDSDIQGSGVYITNYERLERLESRFDAIILDESGILKSFDGHYRKYIQERFEHTRYKLACTATPAPNDYMELGTHAEFVGAMTRQEMLATFFCHDGADTAKWRLKKHAVGDFWRWVRTWAAVFRHPKDLGYDMPGFDLPPLHFHTHRVDVDTIGGGLFGDEVSATNLYKILKASASERVEVVRELVLAEPDEPWLIWVHTDEEQRMIEKAIPNIVSAFGSQDMDKKIDILTGFGSGKYRRLVTKPRLAGFGLNYQVCARQASCGVNYSQ